MDRIALAPILRGAIMELTGAPVFLAWTQDVVDSAAPLSQEVLELATSKLHQDASPLREALKALQNSHGELPQALSTPNGGTFFLGASYDAAQKAMEAAPSITQRFSLQHDQATPSSGRGDVVKGRIALVTGGAQGFGAEIARGLADEGAFVWIADINEEGAAAFAAELNASGSTRAAAVAVDVSDESSVQAMAATIVAGTGGLDLLVSNAGVLRAGSVLQLEAHDFDFVTRINYTAFFLVVKHLAAVMAAQRQGGPTQSMDIVQINSKSGLEGSNKNGAYAGGKFGGLGLVQSFALELVEHGIKVNAICPGNFFDGPLWSHPENGLFVQYLRAGKVPGAQTVADVKAFYEAKVPMGRGCYGPDVLRAILYCVEQAYETGQALPVTGGQVMLK